MLIRNRGLMMNMIKRILIKNFQSHRHTEIEPSPGVNVIVGRNMTGKSALLRALRLLLFNKPGGSAFVSWGTRDTEIEIEYGEHTIRRIKGKRTNIYEIDGSEFKSFGKGVPDEVADVLGMFPIRIADSTYELTIAGPHEPPFLVSETDSIKGKIFSELAEHLLGDLVRLDRAISTANVKLRKMSSESSVLEVDIVSAEEALGRFGPMEGVDKKLSMCHNLLSRAQAVQDSLGGLIECRGAFDRIDPDLSVCRDLSSVYDLGDLDSQVIAAKKAQLELMDLMQARTQWVQIDESLRQLGSRTTVLETIPDLAEAETQAAALVDLMQAQTQLAQIDINLSELQFRKAALETIPDLAEVETLAEELQSLCTVATELQDVDDEMHQLCHDQSKAATSLSFAAGDYGELLLKEKRCPICFGPVAEHDAERIIEELIGYGSCRDTEEG